MRCHAWRRPGPRFVEWRTPLRVQREARGTRGLDRRGRDRRSPEARIRQYRMPRVAGGVRGNLHLRRHMQQNYETEARRRAACRGATGFCGEQRGGIDDSRPIVLNGELMGVIVYRDCHGVPSGPIGLIQQFGQQIRHGVEGFREPGAQPSLIDGELILGHGDVLPVIRMVVRCPQGNGTR